MYLFIVNSDFHTVIYQIKYNQVLICFCIDYCFQYQYNLQVSKNGHTVNNSITGLIDIIGCTSTYYGTTCIQRFWLFAEVRNTIILSCYVIILNIQTVQIFFLCDHFLPHSTYHVQGFSLTVIPSMIYYLTPVNVSALLLLEATQFVQLLSYI